MGVFSKYSPPTCKQVKSALNKAGFVHLRTAGSHEQWAKTDCKGRRFLVTVDCPKAPFSDTLVKSMAMQAGLSKKEFLKLCHDKKYHGIDDIEEQILPSDLDASE